MKRKETVFQDVPRQNVQRSTFDLSHEVKMSAKFGYDYPVLVQETLPGDVFDLNALVFSRFAPMLSPIMHKCDIKVDAFYVPARLVFGQKLAEQFFTGGQDGTATPILPFITPSALYAANGNSTSLMVKNELWDYMHLPVFTGAVPATLSLEQISVAPFRVYQKIWNDWLRDPNLEEDVELNLETQGNVSTTFVANGHGLIKRRGWKRDYFTSCLPFAQRGNEVLMPLVGNVDITYRDVGGWRESGGIVDQDITMDDVGGAISVDSPIAFSGGLGNIRNIEEATVSNSQVSINDVRTAFALQAWMENSARGGGRYVESVLSHFNVRVPDYTLQRAEYIGGMRLPIQISEVQSTSAAEGVPIGDLAGHGIGVGKRNLFKYRCDEHGYVMVLLTCVPQPSYNSQGLERMWTRKTKFDFATPELMNLGEQPVLSKEIFFSFDNADNDENNEEFGYLPRGSEYKYKVDRVAGDFRDGLAFWHLARIFTARPVLDDTFVRMIEHFPAEEETFRRIFAEQDGTDYIWLQVFFIFKAHRPLPYFSVPQLKG